jgi:hypothetical protein
VNKTLSLYDVCTFDLNPDKPITLTSEISQIRKQVQPLPYFDCNNSFTIEVSGIRGVEVAGDGWTISDKLTSNGDKFTLTVISSTMLFYVNGTPLGEYECRDNLVKNFIRGTFFNYFDDIVFGTAVDFGKSGPICPFIFANAQLDSFEIDSLVDCFLVTNLFQFQEVKATSFINSAIGDLWLRGYNFQLNESVMNSLAFEQVQTLGLEGTISGIQVDFKKSFKYLTNIQIMARVFKNFFHQVGLDWTSQVNNESFVTFSEFETRMILKQGVYTYPNEDLCLFVVFPLRNRVTPVLDSAHLTECTDTMAWLTQDYHLYNMTGNYSFTDNARQVYATCWKQNNRSIMPNLTLIESRKGQCFFPNGSLKQRVYKIYADIYTIIYIFQFTQDLIAFVLIPLACLIGLLLNLRVIYTIHKNIQVKLKEDFYKYMSLNSVFNCLFCVVYALYPVNYCSKYERGYFCSPIFNAVAAQVFKIVFMGYLGECLKTSSNIAYILITINRYMLVGTDHNSTLEMISKWKMKRVIFAVTVFSLAMNTGHIFQYRINLGFNSFFEFTNTYALYPSIVLYNTYFDVYALVFFAINFLVFFIVNTCVETSLVLKLRKELAEKRIKADAEIQAMSRNNASRSAVIDRVLQLKRKKIEQDTKKETRVIVMVVANSLVNFILRLPEILVFLSSNYNFMKLLFLLDSSKNTDFSFLITDIDGTTMSVSYFAYILTFTTNVIIYYLFNTKFKQLFQWWKSNVKLK